MELVRANSAAVATKRSTAQTVANVAALLPPKTTDDMPAKIWMQKMVDAIGEHPQEVLEEAYRAVISTCTFAPTAAEFIDAVLVAYARLKVPMSEDGKRHLQYRKKLNWRYVQGEDGRQRFADDVKLMALGFFSLSGVHANMVLDDLQLATVSDVEKAIVELSEKPKPDKHGKLAQSINQLKALTVPIMAHRVYGKPDQFCGGAAALGFYSTYLAISQDTVSIWCREFPHLPIDKMAAELWVITRYQRGQIIWVPDGYGTLEFHKKHEDAIHKALPAAERKHISELSTEYNALWREARNESNQAEMQALDSKMDELRRYADRKGYDGLKLTIDKTPPLTREQVQALMRRPA